MSYNPFKQAILLPNFALGHAIQWKIDPTFKESEPYVFSVEVSGTPDFSEIKYIVPAKDSYIAIDDTNFKQALYVDMFYRVKLETADRNTYYSKTLVFGQDTVSRRQYVLSAEIVRKELLRMRRFTGVESYLLKRKAFGEIRQDAVDPISGVPITDNMSDFGTGLNGGYFRPLKILVTYEDQKATRVLNEGGLGVNETQDVTFRMIGFPLVETQDIIADTVGDARFIVKNVIPTVFPGTGLVLVQKIEAGFIPTTDPIYQIELN